MNLKLLKRLETWDAPNPTAKAVMVWLAYFADPQGNDIFPSMQKIADITGYRRATVHAAYQCLISANVIELQDRRGKKSDGKRKTDTYRLTAQWKTECGIETKEPNNKPTEAATPKAYNPWHVPEQHKPTTPNKPTAPPTKPAPIVIEGGRTQNHPTGNYLFKANVEWLRNNGQWPEADKADKLKQMTVTGQGNGYLGTGATLLSIP